jgi:phytoene synthase
MSAGVQPAPIPFSPTESQLTIAYSVCRAIARGAAKNFYYGFLVLPKRKRQALCAVYAFMRRCDDIADDASLTLRDRRLKLADWLDSMHRAIEGRPTDDPVLLALSDSQRRFQVPVELLDQLAYGTAMDLKQEEEDDEPLFARTASAGATSAVRYATLADLYQYCYHVASVVGLVCIRIFGYRDPGAEVLAERCGLAFQLTNIIRDVKEDAAMDRIYVPQEDLDKFGLTAEDLRDRPDIARVRPLLAFEADRAREFYRSGEELVPMVSEDSQPGLWVLVTIYRALLEKIALKQYDVFTERVSLTFWEKFRILAKGFVQRFT